MKSDSRVAFFCIACIICVGVLFWAVDNWKGNKATADNTEGDTTEIAYAEGGNSQTPIDGQKTAEIHLQNFDPNTADSTVLLALGLPRWMVRGIYKYRAMGGSYSYPEDFARVPGLTQKKYRELLPYIHISADYRPASELVGPRKSNKGDYPSYDDDEKTTSPDGKDASKTQYPKKLSAGEHLSVNSADTTDLQRIPGIGSYFAKKIVDYRARLGGFVSLDQLLEIKNFPEEALSYMSQPSSDVQKININKASFQTLSAHPYIGYKRTKAIMDYRRLKGKITSLSQLSLLSGFTEAERTRMAPYIEY